MLLFVLIRDKNILLYGNLLKEEFKMKNLFKVVVLYIAAGAASMIGVMGGTWLWNEVLEDKADNLKKRFSNKEEEEGY